MMTFPCRTFSSRKFSDMVLFRSVFIKYVQWNTRLISSSCPRCKKQPDIKLKGRSKSSQEWLIRQLTDPYIELTKQSNYRCRSAFKLIEIDDRHHILKPGQVVIDCGACPGSWSQVAVNRCNADKHDELKPAGEVFSVDISPILPLEGATLFSGLDFTLPKCQQVIHNALNGRLFDVVLSDMAPTASGIKDLDDERMFELISSVLSFGLPRSKVGATLLVKLWDCGRRQTLEKDLRRFYEYVKICKPEASRKDSAEIYILARNFKGLKNTST